MSPGWTAWSVSSISGSVTRTDDFPCARTVRTVVDKVGLIFCIEYIHTFLALKENYRLVLSSTSRHGLAPVENLERKAVRSWAGRIEKMFKTFHKHFLHASWICFCTKIKEA